MTIELETLGDFTETTPRCYNSPGTWTGPATSFNTFKTDFQAAHGSDPMFAGTIALTLSATGATVYMFKAGTWYEL